MSSWPASCVRARPCGAEAVLEAGLADLCARPFDQASQEEMRRLLDSDQLREATLIARRMGGQDR